MKFKSQMSFSITHTRPDVYVVGTRGIRRIRAEVDSAVYKARAASTNRNLVSRIKAFLLFCYWSEQEPVPINAQLLAEYMIYLSYNLRSYVSVLNYVSAVRFLAEAHGLLRWDAVYKSPVVKDVRSAVKRRLAGLARARQAFLPEHISAMMKLLKLDNLQDLSTAAGIAIGFFAFLRTSNLMPATRQAAYVKKSHHLQRRDVTFTSYGMLLRIRYSKTNQTGARSVLVPVARHAETNTCPVFLMNKLFNVSNLPGTSSAFAYARGNTIVNPTQATFAMELRSLVKSIGLDSSRYTGHSLRRGGATYAFSLGQPIPLIKLQGDWRSNAVERYLQISQSRQLDVCKIMARKFPVT